MRLQYTMQIVKIQQSLYNYRKYFQKETSMKFRRRHYRPQVDQMDCGVTSLAMVLVTTAPITH